MTGSREQEGASIVPIEALTREATYRRLAELAHRSDGPPREVEDAALAMQSRASAWRSIDDELAALVYDSDRDPEALANVRAIECSTRRLTFRAPDLLLEVEVTLSRPRSLVCQVVPPQPAAIEVRSAGGLLCSESDSFGTFHVPAVPPGPLSLRCTPLDERAEPRERADSVATSWIVI
ncbi:MAG: hypothetical protein ACLQK4_00830 [Acidimicrobiales bacterium]